jgi:hypothetical protein
MEDWIEAIASVVRPVSVGVLGYCTAIAVIYSDGRAAGIAVAALTTHYFSEQVLVRIAVDRAVRKAREGSEAEEAHKRG